MAKGVFTHKAGSIYDDRPEAYYNFPRTYLRAIEKFVGDWIVYYEPRRGHVSDNGRQRYFAIARVAGVRNDPRVLDRFYADVDSYVEFTTPPHFNDDGGYLETSLERSDGKTNKGAFGRAVRQISDAEFERICALGFAGVREDLAEDDWASPDFRYGFAEEAPGFVRSVVQRLTNEKFRAAAFARLVKSAYSETCAMTGLRILNGGGRPEVEAAHIIPVADNGPDTVRNGLALCRTAHWMFDRGLVSVSNDFQILINEAKAPTEAVRLLVPNKKLLLPRSGETHPHQAYLEHHRRVHGFTA